MRLAGFRPTSLFDGKGINFVLFFQGCLHCCKGCQNPSTWDFNGGTEFSEEQIESEILKYKPLISGITLSGGDPLYQKDSALKLATWAKSQNLQTTLYTGFKLSEIFPECCDWDFDFIIDGQFKLTHKTRDFPFRGSSNQNIWKRIPDGFSRVEFERDDGGRFVESIEQTCSRRNEKSR